jgi:hypothetical protein
MSRAGRVTMAISLLFWAGVACSGETESDANPASAVTTGPTTGTGGTTSGGIGGTTSSSACPSIEPSVGSACTEEVQVCWFGNCAAPEYRNNHELTCVGHVWTLSQDDACVACPPTRTFVIGSACDAVATPGPCYAIDACSDLSASYCVDGAWVLESSLDSSDQRAAPIAPGIGGASSATSTVGTSTTTGFPPPPPECPVDAPALGNPCCPRNVPELCAYDVSAGGAGGDQGVSAMLGCMACSQAEMVWEAASGCP